MKNCWEIRGCPKEMKERCPFYTSGAPCTLSCRFTYCDSSKYEPAIGNFSFDRKSKGVFSAVKERCLSCQIYVDAFKEEF